MTDQTTFSSYADYLSLDDLLNAQNPLSKHPDELHFILIHQIHELWFKLVLHHLERAREAVQTSDIPEAVRLIGQVSEAFEGLEVTARHLHSLPPMAFHRFRKLLAPGSGLQSYQFREIEFLAGLRDPRHISWTQRQLAKDSEWEHVISRLEEPSLAEAFDDLLARQDAADIATIYANPQQYPMLYLLCDALSIFDQRVLDWRQTHIQLVERTIGTGTVGTGGTMHDYLRATLDRRFFPALWDARNTLSARVDQT
ncbi:MAG: tryptophan 2,3-dioxygenase family protein [Anaerolineae bacterium]